MKSYLEVANRQAGVFSDGPPGGGPAAPIAPRLSEQQSLQPAAGDLGKADLLSNPDMGSKLNRHPDGGNLGVLTPPQ